MLLPCGHSDNGKAYEGYQRACILLAKNGMAVLCYDPIGQGERYQMLDRKGKPVIRGTTEHTMAGIGALLVGRQLASYRIWDGIRGARLPGEPARGRSRAPGLHGQLGRRHDDRLPDGARRPDRRRGAVVFHHVARAALRHDRSAGRRAEHHRPGRRRDGPRRLHHDACPKPTLLTVGTRDFFDIQGSWDTFREVKLIYGRLGFGERVDLFESDEEHGFTRPGASPRPAG